MIEKIYSNALNLPEIMLIITFVILGQVLVINLVKFIKINIIFKKIIILVMLSVVMYLFLVFIIIKKSELSILSNVVFNGTFALGILAGIPTIYLWSLKEENKQKELRHVDETLKHAKEVYFNERLINILSTENLKEEHKIYQLETLLNDWILHYDNDYKNDKLRNIAIQIISIIFSFERKNKENTILALNKILETYLNKIDGLKNWACFDLDSDYLKTLNFSYLKLFDLNLSYTNLTSCHLDNSSIIVCNFDTAILNEANLNNSKIYNNEFKRTGLVSTNFSGATLHRCVFLDALIEDANFNNATLYNCDFSKTILLTINDNYDMFKNADLYLCVFNEKNRELIERDNTIKNKDTITYVKMDSLN